MQNLNHLAVIQPGEGAKHSLKVLLYNDLKRDLEMNFWKNITAYRSYLTDETVLRRNEDSLALAST